MVVAWLVALVAGGALSAAIGNDYRSDFDLPNVESRAGFDLLEEEFDGLGAGASGSIVFQSRDGFSESERQRLSAFLERVEAIDDTTVRSPFAPGGEGQISPIGEAPGTIAFARIELSGDFDQEAFAEFADQVEDAAPSVDGVRIEYGGQMFGGFEPPSSELLGLAFAIVILIVSFGSVLAMGLPIGVALGGIGIGAILLGLLSNVVSMPDFATTLGVMIGLGVGIDYALFIVTRYREQLRAGHPVVEAVGMAIDTSGRAVTFAGLTVVISLMGMLLMGVNFVQGLGIGAATVVLVTMVASLTLLPALLGFAGERVEVTRVRGLVSAALVAVALVGLGLKVQPLLVGFPLAVVVLIAGLFVPALKRELPRRAHKPLRDTVAYRWSRVVQAHPWAMALLGSGLLIVLALPVFSMRLGFADDGNMPEDRTTRQAYDLLAEGFGPGFNGPLVLVTSLGEETAQEDVAAVTTRLNETDGVAFAVPFPNDPEAPTAVQWYLVPDTAPQDAATADLVRGLRTDVLPAATEGTDMDVLVTGFVAVTVDFADYLSDRLAVFFGAVLALSFLLLMVVFRSLLVPLKAVIMNLLSIGAAYGLVVAIFQWGWAGSVLGIEPAPVEPFLPMMLFAIVFGLSMDYEVFLLSRVREEWVRTGDARASVADGLAATARVITAAAAIMVFVFGSFMLEDDRVIRLFGFGLAVAVLLDATVVRMLLVPATMELLGDRNWWLPKWLDRLLPHVNVEGTPAEVDELLDRELAELVREPEPQP